MGGDFQEIQTEWTQLEVGQIRPDPTRPRQRQRRSINEIVKSIQEFGFVQPIVVDEDYMVIIGHGRLEAARRLKYKTVPVVVISGLSKTNAGGCKLPTTACRNYRIGMNLSSLSRSNGFAMPTSLRYRASAAMKSMKFSACPT